MSNEAMDYVKELVEHAYFIGAAGLIAAAVRTGQIPVMLTPMYAHTAKVRARTYVCRLKVNEKALRWPTAKGPKTKSRPRFFRTYLSRRALVRNPRLWPPIWRGLPSLWEFWPERFPPRNGSS